MLNLVSHRSSQCVQKLLIGEAQRTFHIDFFVGMKTRLNLAVGRETDLIAGGAEVIAEGADEPYLAPAVRKAVILRYGKFFIVRRNELGKTIQNLLI